uniref:Uncharacterized protein n=1 Tax=Cannabis sativa TaxID=3483 RepID=A0A803PRB4_CANSA
MAIELLTAAIKSEDLRDQAFKLRPLVFTSITQHQVQLECAQASKVLAEPIAGRPGWIVPCSGQPSTGLAGQGCRNTPARVFLTSFPTRLQHSHDFRTVQTAHKEKKLKDHPPSPTFPAPSKRKVYLHSPSKRVSKCHRSIEEESNSDFELNDQFIQLAKVAKGKGKSLILNFPTKAGLEEPSNDIVVEVKGKLNREFGSKSVANASVESDQVGPSLYKAHEHNLFSNDDDDFIDVGASMACGVQVVEKMIFYESSSIAAVAGQSSSSSGFQGYVQNDFYDIAVFEETPILIPGKRDRNKGTVLKSHFIELGSVDAKLDSVSNSLDDSDFKIVKYVHRLCPLDDKIGEPVDPNLEANIDILFRLLAQAIFLRGGELEI